MCFPHGRPICLWTTVLLGIVILVFLTWMTLMDELELVQFSLYHQLPPCSRVIQSTVEFVVVLWTCVFTSVVRYHAMCHDFKVTGRIDLNFRGICHVSLSSWSRHFRCQISLLINSRIPLLPFTFFQNFLP